jgi:hypothetical protein
MRQSILLGATLLLFAGVVCADDFKLKDGSKISGTIVGFDDNSFKVQTSYGFAMVRKDQVVSITVADVAKADAKPADIAGKAGGGATSTKGAALVPSASKPLHAESVARALAAPAVAVAAVAPASSVLGSAVPAAPPKPAAPEPVREEVNGTIYTNESYGFRMYKPPDWEVIAGAQSIMPGAIAAMGTNDQTTYLLIGQAPAGKSLASDVNATDQRLRGLMDHFRPLGESRVNIAGTQAVERKFRGSVDDKDWSGTVVFFARGGQLYTVFGMTVADTDLVQIQENVIARAISSLQFAQ